MSMYGTNQECVLIRSMHQPGVCTNYVKVVVCTLLHCTYSSFCSLGRYREPHSSLQQLLDSGNNWSIREAFGGDIRHCSDMCCLQGCRYFTEDLATPEEA